MNSAETVWLQASINGNNLDCDPVRTGHTTTFNSTLIWETDRRSIRQMRLENLPLRVDIFSIKNFNGDITEATKDFIGYILLQIRGIPVLPIAKALKTKCRWTKLIGLPKEWRPFKPEVLMNVMITSRDYLTWNKKKREEIQNILVQDSIMIEENPTPAIMSLQKGIFVRLIQREGLLQVGRMDSDCEVFNVQLYLENIKYLDNAVMEPTDNIANRDFFITYVLLGNNHSKQLDRKFNRTHQIQEKISINFRSSLTVLKEYFEHVFYIPLDVFMNDKLIGSLEIRLNHILEDIGLQEYLSKYPNGQTRTGTIEIKTPVAIDSINKPVLEYKVMVLHQGTRVFDPEENFENLTLVDANAGGDCYREVLVDTKKEQPINEAESNDKIPVELVEHQEPDRKVQEVPSKVSFIQSEKTDISMILQVKESGKVSEIPRLFSYNMQLVSMTFNKRPHAGIWQVSFFHEMADTPRVFINRDICETDIDGNSIKFNDLELKLYFTSKLDNIMDLVKSSQACTICIRGPHNTHAKAFLDCRNLMIGNKEKTLGNILLKNQNETVTALAEVFVFLDDAGLNFNSQRIEAESEHCDELNATKTIEVQKELLFDEELAHGMIEELENWKEQEKMKFLVDLKQNEQKYLEKLKDEFNTMKASYENKYIEKSEQLKLLSRSLEDAHNAIKHENSQNAQSEENLNKMKGEIEQAYADKLRVIKERTKQLEQDFVNELKLKDIKIQEMECNNKILLEKVQYLTHENCDLKETIDKLNGNFESLRGNLVPKEELDNLVREMVSFLLASFSLTNLFFFFKPKIIH